MIKIMRPTKGTFASQMVKILTREFGPPFTPPNLVNARVNRDGTATIKIGDRDVTISYDGKVLDAGTYVGT